MPRPPILPPIDWKALFGRGKTFAAWLAAAENDRHREEMATTARDLPVAARFLRFAEGIERPVHVVCFAEDWCGDVVRHVPVLERLCAAQPQLQTRYLSREDAPDTFARYLTNGGEAVPKFIFLSESFTECANWGPMPKRCRELIARGKSRGEVGHARKKVAALYEVDSSREEVLRELLFCLDIAASTAL
ncbi:MAG: thioredoxin family protein [Bdellovibrionales bacterium]|nr:thioredoxin family protein [Bdellovibrionales bacterium]